MIKNINIERDCIVSATDVVKNFANIRKKTKSGSNIIVFKNNKPDLALLDIDDYASLLQMAELLEDLTINKMVTERYQEDDGTRYTTDDIIALRKQMKESKCTTMQA